MPHLSHNLNTRCFGKLVPLGNQLWVCFYCFTHLRMISALVRSKNRSPSTYKQRYICYLVNYNHKSYSWPTLNDVVTESFVVQPSKEVFLTPSAQQTYLQSRSQIRPQRESRKWARWWQWRCSERWTREGWPQGQQEYFSVSFEGAKLLKRSYWRSRRSNSALSAPR